MINVRSIVTTTAAILALSLVAAAPVQAAKFSSTKAELLYGQDYPRGPGFSDVNQTILTLANASGFSKGDSYFFVDLMGINDSDATGGSHLEWGPRLSFPRVFGGKQWDGVVKDFYVIVQGDFTSNTFVSKWVPMGGLSLDWKVPGFKFLKTHVQYRDDPTLTGSSIQYNLVWNSSWTWGPAKFSFEGFLDYTTEEGTAVANLLTQPQLLWHATDNFGVGIEYQYWQNRLGIDGLDEEVPQIMVRWTF